MFLKTTDWIQITINDSANINTPEDLVDNLPEIFNIKITLKLDQNALVVTLIVQHVLIQWHQTLKILLIVLVD